MDERKGEKYRVKEEMERMDSIERVKGLVGMDRMVRWGGINRNEE
jgi:hypothetical protein